MLKAATLSLALLVSSLSLGGGEAGAAPLCGTSSNPGARLDMKYYIRTDLSCPELRAICRAALATVRGERDPRRVDVKRCEEGIVYSPYRLRDREYVSRCAVVENRVVLGLEKSPVLGEGCALWFHHPIDPVIFYRREKDGLTITTIAPNASRTVHKYKAQ